MKDPQHYIRIMVALEPIIGIHVVLFFFLHASRSEWAYSGIAYFFTVLVHALTYFVKIFEEKEDFPDTLATIRKGYFISIIGNSMSLMLMTFQIPFSSVLALPTIVAAGILVIIVLIKEISFEQLLSISETLTFLGLFIMTLTVFIQTIS